MAWKCSPRGTLVLQLLVGMAAVNAEGCAQVLGIDQDYHPISGGGTGGATGGNGGGGTTTTTTTSTVPCDVATCPAPPGECEVALCDEMGMCSSGNADDGTPAKTQIAGDCKKNVCTGGSVVSQDDNTDVENDNQTCTDDGCSAGTATHAPKAKGTTCTENNGNVCDTAGTAWSAT